jgi:hypothetical protein
MVVSHLTVVGVVRYCGPHQAYHHQRHYARRICRSNQHVVFIFRLITLPAVHRELRWSLHVAGTSCLLSYFQKSQLCLGTIQTAQPRSLDRDWCVLRVLHAPRPRHPLRTRRREQTA